MSVSARSHNNGSLNIHLDLDEVDQAVNFLQAFGRQAQKPIVRALNRAATGVRTDSVRAARDIYNVKAKTLRNSIAISKAKAASRGGPATLFAKLRFQGSRIPLYEFGVRPRQPRHRRPPRVGASVLVKHSSGRSKIAGSFVADMPARGLSLYYRPGKDRNKVLKMYSLSVPQMVSDTDATDKIVSGARTRFNKNLDHEIDRFFAKRGLR